MLEISKLSVSYGHITALTDVSFTVKRGTIVSIIGTNGAGKSTLLNAISGVVKKQNGEIKLNGEILPKSANRIVKKGIVQVPEGRRIFTGLTIEENLIMGGYRISAKKAREKFALMYKLFPILGERKLQKAGTLSGGEQQMLAIARGLIAEPEILLLDEPSLGLAPIIVKQVFNIINEINSTGITILLNEQNASQAMAISDYTYVLENGVIAFHGKSSELISQKAIRRAYLGQ